MALIAAGETITDASGKLRAGRIADNAVDTDQLAADAVEAAELASNAVVNASVASNANIAGSKLDTSVLENNIAMLGFYRAVDGSKAKYSLVDQVIDDFQDTTGIDAGNSTNEVHDNTNKYFGGSTLTTTVDTYTTSNVNLQGSSESLTPTAFTVPSGVTSITIHAFGAGGIYAGYSIGTLATSAGTEYGVVAGTVADTVGSAWSAYGYGFGGRGYSYLSAGGLSGVFTGHGDLTGHSDSSRIRAVIVAGGAGSRSGSGHATAGSGGGASGTSGNGSAGPGTQSGAGAGHGGGEGGNDMRGGNSSGGVEHSSGGGGYYGGGGTGSGGAGGAGGSGFLHANLTSAGTYVGNSSEKTSDTYYAASNHGKVVITYQSGQVDDVTLQSVATTAESAPDTGDIIILIEDSAGTATINTDIKAYISRDGSAFSSEVVLLDEGDWGTNKRILAAHDVDISGITSGTSMKYKITTHNQDANKETRVHAVSLAWS